MSLREQKKQASRDAILDAANALIERKGLEQATMRDIARAANVSYQTLYNYFPTKAVIIQTLLTEDLSVADESLERIMDDPSRPLIEVLGAMVRQSFDAIDQRDRHLWREVTVALIRQSEDFQAFYSMIDSTSHARLGKLLRRSQDSGELDAGVDVAMLAHVIFVVVDFAFLRYIMNQTRSKTEVLASIREQIAMVVTPYLRSG